MEALETEVRVPQVWALVLQAPNDGV
jgi:hypothetical protein